jgi:hypothetical protein
MSDGMSEKNDLLTRIAQATGVEPKKVDEVVQLALQEFHRITIVDEKGPTAAVMEACFSFGGEAAFHLIGLYVSEHDYHGRHDDAGIWNEVAMRFIPDEYRDGCKRIAPWFAEKTAARVDLDAAIQNAKLAKRRAAQPLKPKAAQKPLETGLFGEKAKQEDLFARPSQAETGLSIQELKALARNHWAQWLPEKVRELKAEGKLNEALQGAASLAQAEIEHLMKYEGYSVHEAREVALPLFILLKPEPAEPDEQDEELAEKEREYQRVYGQEEEQGDPNEGFLPWSTAPSPEKTESSKPLARLPTRSEAEEMTTRYMSEGSGKGGNCSGSARRRSCAWSA